LLCNLPEKGLYAGDIGTVVEQHHVEGLETGYSVELFDMLGNIVAVATLAGSYWRFNGAIATDAQPIEIELTPELLSSHPFDIMLLLDCRIAIKKKG